MNDGLTKNMTQFNKLDGWLSGWMDRQIDGYMDKWVGRWMIFQ